MQEKGLALLPGIKEANSEQGHWSSSRSCVQYGGFRGTKLPQDTQQKVWTGNCLLRPNEGRNGEEQSTQQRPVPRQECQKLSWR